MNLNHFKMAKKRRLKPKKEDLFSDLEELDKSVAKKSRKKSSKAKPEEKPYFIGLNNPTELRKNILEPTREVIQFLQNYEEFKKIKEEKTKYIIQLKDDLKQIRLSVNQLKKALPQNKLRIEKPKKIKEAKKEALPVEAKAAPAPLLPPTELDSLEKELNEIEKKLGSLY